MKNKFLNIIGIIAVAIAIVLAIFTTINKDGKMELGNFNIHALVNAEQTVNNAIADARGKIEELVKIENKTYMNFVRPLMDVSAELDETMSPIHHLNAAMNSEESQKIVEAIIPVTSEFSSYISRHRGIYDGFISVRQKEYDRLTDGQKIVVDDTIKSMEIAGISLPADKQDRLREIDTELSKLSNDFSNNIIAANKLNKIKITDAALLGEMPETDKAAAATDGGWEFSLLAPSYSAFMKYVTSQYLRQKMYKNYVTRAPQNEQLIPQILKLRAEQAKILGFKNYAELALQFRDAKTPAAVDQYQNDIVKIVKPIALREYAAEKEFSGIDMQPWDEMFYSRLLIREKFKLDEAQLKPYFEMNAVVDKTMDIFSKMYDIRFRERRANKWHDDVRYFDVMQNDHVIGGLYMDLSTRDNKRGGAWADMFYAHYLDAQDKEHMPVASIVANFAPATPDAPSLLSVNDVRTLFHELGHAMHVVLSKSNEFKNSGYNTYWDVVEYPSQFQESFVRSPAVLKMLGKHYQTGDVIPDELIDQVIATSNFQRAWQLTVQIEYGMFDMEIHQQSDMTADDVQKVLNSVRERVRVMPTTEYNKFQNTFSHIFAGGYSAGYYSYLWAQSLAADTYIALDGDPFNQELAYKYRDTVLATGGDKLMSDIYKEFLGRAPNPDSLLKYYGLK